MMRKMKSVLARGCEVASNCALILCAAIAIALSSGAPAYAVAEAVTVTELVDVESGITTAVTTIAGTVAVCVGAWFGFMLVRKGMRWGRRAVG